MTANEWLAREVDSGRVSVAPPDEALDMAVALLRSFATTTKTPGPIKPSVFISRAEVGGHVPATATA